MRINFYLKYEFSHFCDFRSAFFETLQVIRGEDEVPLLPLRKEFVSLLPQQTLLHGGLGPQHLTVVFVIFRASVVVHV